MSALQSLLDVIDRDPYRSPIPFFSGFSTGINEGEARAIQALLAIAPEDLAGEVGIIIEMLAKHGFLDENFSVNS